MDWINFEEIVQILSDPTSSNTDLEQLSSHRNNDPGLSSITKSDHQAGIFLSFWIVQLSSHI